MAHLKLKDWAKAESDATSALEIDPGHVKSYQRRSAARSSLGKLRAALRDLHLAEVAAAEASGGPPPKRIVSERRRVEAALRAAVHRAPRRKVPIVVVKEDGAATPPRESGRSLPGALVIEGTDSREHGQKSTQQMQMIDSATDPVPCSDGDSRSGEKPDPRVDSGENNRPEEKSVGDVGCAFGGLPPGSDDISVQSGNKAAGRKLPRAKPKTWYEFETAWRALGARSERAEFLRGVRPRKLASLYRNGIEDVDTLVGMIVAAADVDGGADYLRAIVGVRSLDMTVMMMTDVHREMVREAIRKCFGRDEGDGDAGEVASKLGC